MVVVIVEGEMAALGLNVTSHCKTNGDFVAYSVPWQAHERWRRGFSQITLGFLVCVVTEKGC